MSSLEDSRLDVREVFLSIGLDVKTVEKALVNAKFRDNLLEVILEVCLLHSKQSTMCIIIFPS